MGSVSTPRIDEMRVLSCPALEYILLRSFSGLLAGVMGLLPPRGEQLLPIFHACSRAAGAMLAPYSSATAVQKAPRCAS